MSQNFNLLNASGHEECAVVTPWQDALGSYLIRWCSLWLTVLRGAAHLVGSGTRPVIDKIITACLCVRDYVFTLCLQREGERLGGS